MDEKVAAIIDAATEVAVFSKTHTWPVEGSPAFFEFAQKLDALATAINGKYPAFNRNIQTARTLDQAPWLAPVTAKPEGLAKI